MDKPEYIECYKYFEDKLINILKEEYNWATHHGTIRENAIFMDGVKLACEEIAKKFDIDIEKIKS